MKTRISLTIDPEVHRSAKRLARTRGTSVSGLVESLLGQQVLAESPSVVEQLIGSAALRVVREGMDARHEHLRRKYLAR
jgi:hypothetical protein